MMEEILKNYYDVLKENTALKNIIDSLISDNLKLAKKLLELEEVYYE